MAVGHHREVLGGTVHALGGTQLGQGHGVVTGGVGRLAGRLAHDRDPRGSCPRGQRVLVGRLRVLVDEQAGGSEVACHPGRELLRETLELVDHGAVELVAGDLLGQRRPVVLRLVDRAGPLLLAGPLPVALALAAGPAAGVARRRLAAAGVPAPTSGVGLAAPARGAASAGGRLRAAPCCWTLATTFLGHDRNLSGVLARCADVRRRGCVATVLSMARKCSRGHLSPGGLCPIVVRRRPTLPQPLGCSTIGAERLNFRVRDGTGCFPFAMAAVTLAEHTHTSTRVGGGVPSLMITVSCVLQPVRPMGCVGWELHVDAGIMVRL